jgi:hypothetical protein
VANPRAGARPLARRAAAARSRVTSTRSSFRAARAGK